jgi:tetratricopeptide (TPR) repeat protein
LSFHLIVASFNGFNEVRAVVMNFHSVIAALVATVVLLGSESQAAPGEEDPARTAFREGTVHFEAGRYGEAAGEFRKAYELKPSWKLLYNIGQSEAASRNYGLALQAFERYLAEGGDELETDRRDEVLAEVERLRKMVGALVVIGPEGATVEVDEHPRGQLPLPGPLMISAGIKHQVAVISEGERLLERPVLLSGGQRIEVRVDGPDEEEAPPEVPAVEEPGGRSIEEPVMESESGEARRPRPLFWVGLGSAIAAGVGAGITWGLAAVAKGDYETARDDYRVLDPDAAGYESEEASTWKEMDDSRGKSETLNGVAIGLTALTGALAVGTVVIHFVDNRDDELGPTDEAIAWSVYPGGVAGTF